uniref:Transmembrane protein 217 n=1 Tax=Sciurus vulgaris TaxID=55149 RepID=A0A8D2CMY6_SCIVU
MDARMLSFIVGLFSLFNTIQLFIFDLNQMTYIGYQDKFHIYKTTDSALDSWVMSKRKLINTFLSVITVAVSCFLLYCIHHNVYTGLPIYAVWIVLYECIHLSIVILLHKIIKNQFRELSHLYLVFQVSRMILHFCGLPCVATHGYSIYKDSRILGKPGRRRHSSISTMDSW